MTPDKLRALADALEPMAKAPRFEDFDVPAFCAWLRACADAEPVAWRYLGFSPFTQMPERDYTFIRFPKGIDAYSSENGATVEPLYTNPAPAAPQAEPKRGLTCLWSRADDDTDTWETACRHAFTLIEGTPTDNSMAFCCYCGRPLEQEIGDSDERPNF